MTETVGALAQHYSEYLSRYYICRSCKIKFDSFGNIQRHILLEHMQKGDIISGQDSEKSDPNVGLKQKQDFQKHYRLRYQKTLSYP
jgi:hypothetical protein